MTRYLFAGMVAAMAALGVVAAPVNAAPQCQFGPDVTADCPPGGCPESVLGQAEPCTGPALEPLFPASPPVKVEIGTAVG